MERQEGDFCACRIGFRLITDIVLSMPIRFDGLLSALFYNVEPQHLGKTQPEDLPLPIRKLTMCGQWFWDCSLSVMNVEHRQMDKLKKDIDDMGHMSINKGSGPHCSIFKTFERLSCKSITFFVYGDEKKLREYVNTVNDLGSMRKNGFGWVEGVTITKTNAKYCAWDVDTKCLLRDIPFAKDEISTLMTSGGLTLRNGRCRPPYFRRYTKDAIMLIGAGSLYPKFDEKVKIL